MKNRRCLLFVPAVVFLLTGVPSWGDERIAEGLKEALNVGIKEVVKTVGMEDGYYKNADIKIPLPEKLEKAGKTIKNLGGDQISEALVMKMNRAAEKAAPEAKEIFISSVKKMKIEDAMKVFSGEKNAATSYLQETASDDLKKAFYPIVKTEMEEINALKTYNEYVDKLNSGGIEKVGSMLKSSGIAKTGIAEIADIELDINRYVTDKAIDGLFEMLSREETKIRENPEARVTDLLKDVFGGLVK